MYSKPLGSVGELAATRANGHEAAEHDGVPAAGQPLFEVM
jgi:hypothetical protein